MTCTLPDKSQDSLLQNRCHLVLSVGRKALGQDPISGILKPTDENIGSRMKTCLSIIDSYDEIMRILYFLSIYLFYDEFVLL
jgi:transcriptional regulator